MQKMPGTPKTLSKIYCLALLLEMRQATGDRLTTASRALAAGVGLVVVAQGSALLLLYHPALTAFSIIIIISKMFCQSTSEPSTPNNTVAKVTPATPAKPTIDQWMLGRMMRQQSQREGEKANYTSSVVTGGHIASIERTEVSKAM